jgi:hypothetical protein
VKLALTFTLVHRFAGGHHRQCPYVYHCVHCRHERPVGVRLWLEQQLNFVTGATLKQIRDQTNVRIDIPRRDLVTPNGNGNARSGAATPVDDDDDDEEPTIPVTITGPQPLAEEAQELIKQIITSKASKITRRVRDIPAHVVPFIKARRQVFVDAAQGADIQLGLNSTEREVTVTGNREAVVRVIEAIKSTVAGVSSAVTCVKFGLPKRQHRLLMNKAVDEIMAESKCCIVVPLYDDASEDVNIWGRPEDVGAGITAAMAKANSKYIHEFPLPSPLSLSRQLLVYMVRTNYVQKLTSTNYGVEVYVPSIKSNAPKLSVDLAGDKSDVDGAVRQLSELMGKMINATRGVEADWLVHKIIASKNAKKCARIRIKYTFSVRLRVLGSSSSKRPIMSLCSSPRSPRNIRPFFWCTTRCLPTRLSTPSRRPANSTKSRKRSSSSCGMRPTSRVRVSLLRINGTTPLRARAAPL